MKNDKIINLREKDSLPDFKVRLAGEADTAPVSEEEIAAMSPQEKVKLSFGRFVNLAMNRNYEEIVEKHFNDEVIMSADLLADLANADTDDGDEKKASTMLIYGLVLGIILTWFILKY